MHSLCTIYARTLLLVTYGTTDEFSIYSWDERVEKYRCFDFGDFLTAIDIENNIGTDVKIIPCFGGDIRMRDHDDSNDI
jgi:hypothetical protein